MFEAEILAIQEADKNFEVNDNKHLFKFTLFVLAFANTTLTQTVKIKIYTDTVNARFESILFKTV